MKYRDGAILIGYIMSITTYGYFAAFNRVRNEIIDKRLTLALSSPLLAHVSNEK